MVTDEIATEEERAAIAREIHDLLAPAKLKKNQTTVSIYARTYQITPQKARTRLDRGVREGKLIRLDKKVFFEGRWQWAYEEAAPKKPPEPFLVEQA